MAACYPSEYTRVERRMQSWHIVRQAGTSVEGPVEGQLTQSKLTVRVDRRWIEPAKAYAARHRTSLSRLISEYLRSLTMPASSDGNTPVLQRLTGVLPPDVDREDHRRYLEEKHLGG
jgi:hypothetical protein